MKHQTAIIILGACLCGAVACTKKIEKTYVEREQPQKVVVEERSPQTITRERVTEEQTSSFGDPIEQRRRTTTTIVR